MNPRHVARGPKRLKNLPPGLRRYWQRVRGIGRRVTNPRKKRRKARVVTTISRSIRRTNPRRSSPMAARRRKHHALTAHQRRSRAARKAARTRARRRPAAAFGSNPRRRYRHLRNPRRIGRGGSVTSVKGIKSLAMGAGVGAIGAVGLDYLWQYASGYLPATLQSGYVGTFAKAGVAVGAGWLASKAIGRQAALAGSLGALTVIAYQLVHQMIAQAAPTAAIAATTTTATPAVAGLGAYMQRSALGWVSPGTPLALRGLGRVGAYMQPAGAPAPLNVGRPGGSVSMSGLAAAGSW
jgi:hypothetical protein